MRGDSSGLSSPDPDALFLQKYTTKEKKVKSRINRRGFLKTAAAAGAVAGVAMTGSRATAKETEGMVPIPDEPVTREDYQALCKMAKEVFDKNSMTREGYTFHVPSIGSYPTLFAWDSGWNAMGCLHVDPKVAASEIEYLLMQQMDDGRVPHEVEFMDIGVNENLKTRLGRVISKDQFQTFGNRVISVQMDPPSYIVAAEKIYDKLGDKEWVKRCLPYMERHIEFMTTKRDLFKDGLSCIIHPWESGTDTSPAYDEILHMSYKTPFGAPYRMLSYPAMFTRHKKLGYDINKIAEDNRFIVEDLTVIGIGIRAVQSVAKLNDILGNPDKAKSYRAKAQKMMDAVDEAMWDEQAGCYFIRYDLKKPKLSKRVTCASLLPLWSGLVKKDRAERIIHEYVLNPKKFWLKYLFPFNPADDMAKEKIYMEDLILWRGHCIWTNMNIMICEALLSYGYKAEAKELTRRSTKMILNQGFREFYDFRNGQGRRAKTFGWPGVTLDMIHQTWPEAASG